MGVEPRRCRSTSRDGQPHPPADPRRAAQMDRQAKHQQPPVPDLLPQQRMTAAASSRNANARKRERQPQGEKKGERSRGETC